MVKSPTNFKKQRNNSDLLNTTKINQKAIYSTPQRHFTFKTSYVLHGTAVEWDVVGTQMIPGNLRIDTNFSGIVTFLFCEIKAWANLFIGERKINPKAGKMNNASIMLKPWIGNNLTHQTIHRFHCFLFLFPFLCLYPCLSLSCCHLDRKHHTGKIIIVEFWCHLWHKMTLHQARIWHALTK